MKARFAGAICGLCNQAIRVGEQIMPRHGAYIHRGCAPGQDDE